MSDQANTPGANLLSLSTLEAHSVADSSVLHHESCENGTDTDTAMHASLDFSAPWGMHTPDQQQQQQQQYQQLHYLQQQYPEQQHPEQQHPEPQYQLEHHQQSWPGQQHTQTPFSHGNTTNCVPTWPGTNTLNSSPPASLDWTSEMRPTGSYDVDWYLSQVLHHIPLGPTVGNAGLHVASLPDLERAPPTEIQSTSSAHSDFGVTRRSGSKLGSAYSRRHGRPQNSSRSGTAGIVSKRRSHRSGGRHDRKIRRPNDRSWTVRDQDCLDTVLLMDELTKHQRTALVMQKHGHPRRSREEYESLFREP